MRVVSISPESYEKHRHYLEEMHRLRAKIFHDRLNWNVQIPQGLESDEYDSLEPTYILAINKEDKVAGCARLLPATGPTMLERTFPRLLTKGRLESHSTMIESSRFCVDTSLVEGRHAGAIHKTTLIMLAAIMAWCLDNGYNEVVTATDLRFERILNRAGWPMLRLGDPLTIGNTVAIAGRLLVDRQTLAAMCARIMGLTDR